MLSRFWIALLLAVVTTASAQELPRDERVPGGVAILLLGGPDEAAPQARFKDKQVLVVRRPDGWVAIVGLDLKLEAGEHVLQVRRNNQDGEVRFSLQAKDYVVQQLTVDPRFVKLKQEDLDRYQKDRAAIERAFATWSEQVPVLKFELPARGPLTSPFRLRRFFNKEERAAHSGTDIAAAEGTAVTAPAPGTVIETGDYFFNGNTVFLDHGQGVITMYNHLRKISVKPGARVQTGDKIGEIGRTGRVTGAHLHWAVVLNGSLVNPLLFVAPEALNAPNGKR